VFVAQHDPRQPVLSYKLGSYLLLGCAKPMSKHVAPVSQSDNVSSEGDFGQRTTGEGSESAMAVLRDRRDVDDLIAEAAERDTDSSEPAI
jgi:hypothetical protein